MWWGLESKQQQLPVSKKLELLSPQMMSPSGFVYLKSRATYRNTFTLLWPSSKCINALKSFGTRTKMKTSWAHCFEIQDKAKHSAACTFPSPFPSLPNSMASHRWLEWDLWPRRALFLNHRHCFALQRDCGSRNQALWVSCDWLWGAVPACSRSSMGATVSLSCQTVTPSNV